MDNMAPSIEINLTSLIFSPNGDGRKDLLIIEQDGSFEKLWEGYLVNSEGKEIRTYSWENKEPKNFSWNGKNADNNPAEDGEYTYQISSTDKAGNTTVSKTDSFAIDTTETNISVGRSYQSFSPNGDGRKDELPIKLQIPVSLNFVKWGFTS